MTDKQFDNLPPLGQSVSSTLRQFRGERELAIPTDLSSLKRHLKEAEAARDLISHGVWTIDPNTAELCIQNTKGEWHTGPKQPSLRKRLYPEALPISEQWFKQTRDKIMQTTKDTDKMYLELQSALETSRNKPSQQGAPNRSPDQTPKQEP